MVRIRLRVLSFLALAISVALNVSSSSARPVVEGHGGGAGHAPGGFPRGWYSAYHPGFRGGFGYPGWCGVGVGFGLGYAYGYGYPYYPYGYGYPIYVDSIYGPPPVVNGQAVPYAAQAPIPNAHGNPGSAHPIRLTETDVILSVRVPPEAIVQINGTKTSQTGPRREFLSSGLTPGRSYTFAITAQWMGPAGNTVELERRIAVQGGERRNIDFMMPAPQ